MIEKEMENNKVVLSGAVLFPPRFHHEVRRSCFYYTTVEIRRKSGTSDLLPVLIPEALLQDVVLERGTRILVVGEFRSFNQQENGQKHMLLSVTAQSLKVLPPGQADEDEISLMGYICRQPTLRRTPFGRVISDVLLAVNHSRWRVDYIPCICWGRTAGKAGDLKVGDAVRVRGRIQSREYVKRAEGCPDTVKTAYEVSVITLELV